jgi:hypothetical protein
MDLTDLIVLMDPMALMVLMDLMDPMVLMALMDLTQEVGGVNLW